MRSKDKLNRFAYCQLWLSRDALNPDEDAEKFLSEFVQSIKDLQNEIEHVTGTAINVRQACEHILIRITELDGAVSRSAYYLTPYDVRQSRLTLSDLRKKVQEKREMLAPKKKFTFSKKPSAAQSSQKSEIQNSLPEKMPSVLPGLGGVTGRTNEQVLVDVAATGSRGCLVSQCSGCTIRLIGDPPALQLRALEDCMVIVVGCVQGATMMFNLKRCTVYAASAQIRIHDSIDCRLLLHVRSHPIIEDSKDLKFGQLVANVVDVLSSEEQDLLENGRHRLCEDNDLWSSVQDFNWLKDTPSPNWYNAFVRQ